MSDDDYDYDDDENFEDSDNDIEDLLYYMWVICRADRSQRNNGTLGGCMNASKKAGGRKPVAHVLNFT